MWLFRFSCLAKKKNNNKKPFGEYVSLSESVDTDCPICIDKVQQPVRLECNHVFCKCFFFYISYILFFFFMEHKQLGKKMFVPWFLRCLLCVGVFALHKSVDLLAASCVCVFFGVMNIVHMLLFNIYMLHIIYIIIYRYTWICIIYMYRWKLRFQMAGKWEYLSDVSGTDWK